MPRINLPLPGVLPLLLAGSATLAGTIDATTGASIHLTQGTTTSSTATFLWQENRPNGHLCHFYDTADVPWSSMKDSVCWSFYSVQTASGWDVRVRPNRDTLRGLAPGKTYHWVLQGFYPLQPDGSYLLAPEYVTSGTFSTDASTSLRRRALPDATPTVWCDLLGRPFAGDWQGSRIGAKVSQIRTPSK